MAEGCFSLERAGSREAFEAIGLPFENLKPGLRFCFYNEDGDEHENATRLCVEGITDFLPDWGWVAKVDESCFYTEPIESPDSQPPARLR